MGTPWDKEQRLKETYGLSDYQAQLIGQEREIVEYFEGVMAEVGGLEGKEGLGGKEVANTIINKKIGLSLKPQDFICQLQKMAVKTTIDDRTLKEMVKGILEDNNAILTSYRKGREQVLGVVVGLVKKQTGAIVDFQTIKNIIDQL